jgi:hypothetical protein
MANLLVERRLEAKLVLIAAIGDLTPGLGAQGGDLNCEEPPRLDGVVRTAFTPHRSPPRVTVPG